MDRVGRFITCNIRKGFCFHFIPYLGDGTLCKGIESVVLMVKITAGQMVFLTWNQHTFIHSSILIKLPCLNSTANGLVFHHSRLIAASWHKRYKHIVLNMIVYI